MRTQDHAGPLRCRQTRRTPSWYSSRTVGADGADFSYPAANTHDLRSMLVAAKRFFGQSVRRFEDPRLLLGKGSFLEDQKLPGMLHAAFVRSPYAHATIVDVPVAA